MNYLHIPKTGGSSIKSMKIPNLKCHPHETIAIDIQGDAFAVIRDPIDRFVSAFYFLKKHTPEFKRMEWSIEEFVERLKDNDQKAISYMFSPHFRFKSFCAGYRPVFIPQHFWVNEHTKLVPFEYMPEAIKSKWGGDVPHLNKSDRIEPNFSTGALNWLKEFYSIDFELYKRAKACKKPYI